MNTLAIRERARAILYAANHPHFCPPVGRRAHQWAEAIIAGPLAFATVQDVIHDAEAAHEIGERDGDVAEIADRTIRGEGITIRYERKDIQRPGYIQTAPFHRIVVDLFRRH